MTSKSKRIGNALENQIVKAFKDAGMEAKRAWGSNGEAMGEHKDVDVLVNYRALIKAEESEVDVIALGEKKLKIQSKKKKELPKWIGLSEYVDASVVREKYGDMYIIMRLNDFIKRIL